MELRIASPCSADWDRMKGDERVRYCPECKLNVYNFDAMESAEIESLVRNREGRLCARFYARPTAPFLHRIAQSVSEPKSAAFRAQQA